MGRLWRAGSVSVALFILTSGAFGFVEASADGDQVTAVPFPGPGDRATFDAFRGQGQQAAFRVTLEWLPAAFVLDRDFNHRLALPLQAKIFHDSSGQVTTERIAYYDAATLEPFVEESAGQWLERREDVGLLGTGATTHAGSAARHERNHVGPLGECAMLGDVHGQATAPAKARILGGCSAASNSFILDSGGGAGGAPLHRYVQGEDGSVAVTYDASSPFPKEYTSWMVNWLQDETHEPGLYRFVRTDDSRGPSPYPELAASVVAPGLGPASPAPRERLRIDSAGLDSLVSYDVAWEAIRQDLVAPRMVDFLASRPDAYLADVTYTETFEDDGTRRGYWTVAVSDGVDTLQKLAEIRPVAKVGPINPLGYTIAVRDTAYDYFTHPTPDRLPDQLISLADQIQRYRKFVGGPDVLVNSFSMWHDCGPACDQVNTTMWVGHTHQSHEDALGSVDGIHFRFQLLGTALDGTATRVFGYEQVRAGELPVNSAYQTPAPPAPMHEDNVPAWLPPTGPAAAGLGILAVLGGALYHFWPAIKAGSMWGGFTRIAASDLLAHPNRRAIARAVEENPGIHFQELHRLTGVARGTLKHHLQKLEEAGLVRSRASSNRLCYFSEDVGREAAAAAAVLRVQGTRRVYEALQTHPDANTADLAERVGLSPSTVSYHRQKLREAGLAA